MTASYFLDADTLALRNCDRLFDYPEFSAAPNVYDTLADFRRLNSGVFVARPDHGTFRRMMEMLDRPGAFWRRTDQTFLQTFFPDWHGLPVFCNMLQYVWMNLPGLWHWPSIRVLHYQYEKPWQTPHPKADRLAPLIDLWWAYAGDGPVPIRRQPAAAGMRIAVTGATGLVGHPVAAALLAAGHQVTALGRAPSSLAAAGFIPYDLAGEPPPLAGHDALVHIAFSHVPGRYRGGEGDDPEGFSVRNLAGSLRLFGAAQAAGVRRVLFLSSRAVYGTHPPGTILTEDLPPRPDTLYGQLKLDAETGLATLRSAGLGVASLRATGVYGPPVPGRAHKWHDLFAGFARGEALPPSIGTEVHAADLAAAVGLLLTAPAEALAPATFNVSDFILDRRELLEAFARHSGIRGTLPPNSDPATVNPMSTDRLRALGWKPRGHGALDSVLTRLCAGQPVQEP